MTVEEILKEWLSQTDTSFFKEGHYFVIKEAMKEYAEEVLKIAAEKATITLEESSNDPYDHYAIVDKDSILNCLK